MQCGRLQPLTPPPLSPHLHVNRVASRKGQSYFTLPCYENMNWMRHPFLNSRYFTFAFNRVNTLLVKTADVETNDSAQ